MWFIGLLRLLASNTHLLGSGAHFITRVRSFLSFSFLCFLFPALILQPPCGRAALTARVQAPAFLVLVAALSPGTWRSGRHGTGLTALFLCLKVRHICALFRPLFTTSPSLLTVTIRRSPSELHGSISVTLWCWELALQDGPPECLHIYSPSAFILAGLLGWMQHSRLHFLPWSSFKTWLRCFPGESCCWDIYANCLFFLCKYIWKLFIYLLPERPKGLSPLSLEADS